LKELAASIDSAVRAAGGDDEDVARTLIGVMQGMPPTISLNLMSALRKWTSSKALWDLQHELPRKPLAQISYEDAASTLYAPLLASMRASPVPPTLWRTAARDCKVGNVDVKAGERVVVGLASAIATCPTHTEGDDLVFGGKYGEATHSCPGRDMAIGVMVGVVCALLKAGSLRPTANPLALVLRG
jgi:hypothetical protein